MLTNAQQLWELWTVVSGRVGLFLDSKLCVRACTSDSRLFVQWNNAVGRGVKVTPL
jgi:hypothetical protein